eukprot:6194395-Pleurochrysis_carterae.AAC.1
MPVVALDVVEAVLGEVHATRAEDMGPSYLWVQTQPEARRFSMHAMGRVGGDREMRGRMQ